MQIIKVFKSFIYMTILSIVTSCAASKEYSGKLFAPRTPVVTDSQEIALRFLELDKLEINNENMVSTDRLMGRDTGINTVALDNFTSAFPLINDTAQTNFNMYVTKNQSVNKSIVLDSIVVAKSGEIRNKKVRE